jgi:outer membrane protein with beta-barrel domain
MRVGVLVGIGLLIASIGCPPAFAGREVYLTGGLSLSNLGGDADLFGQDFADQLEVDIGGVWTSQKKMRAGFDMGLGVSFTSSGVLGGALEVRYVTRGAKFQFDETSGSTLGLTGTWKLDYIEIPTLIRVTPEVSGSIRPVLLFGPVLGVKASSSFEVTVQGSSASVPVGEGMKSTYFAGLAGAGIAVGFSPRTSFQLQARYQHGFTNLIDATDPSFKSTGFSILTGLSWTI